MKILRKLIVAGVVIFALLLGRPGFPVQGSINICVCGFQ